MRRTVPQLKRFKTVNIIFKAEHEIKSPNFALYERENSTANESHFYFIHGSAFTFLTESKIKRPQRRQEHRTTCAVLKFHF